MPERGTNTVAQYRGENAYVQQRDAWDTLRRLLPRSNQFVYGGDYIANAHEHVQAAPLTAANTTYWALLRPLDSDMVLKEARLRIELVQASQHIKTAFYKLAVSGDERMLIKQSESQADFPTDNTGTITVDVGGGLFAGQDYFLGFMSTHATPRCACAYIMQEAWPLLVKASTTDLPAKQLVRELDSATSADEVPLVAYYSAIGAEIWS